MTTEATLQQIAQAVISANNLREASYIAGADRYALTHHEASEQASDEAGLYHPAARALVEFLHVSGEGVDVCRGMLKTLST